jgi:hypothetical protein
MKTKAKAKSRRTPGTVAAPSSSSALSTTLARDAEGDGVGEKQSWGEWFGGYSMAISRAVKNIEAEAAIESQREAAAPIQGKTKAKAKAKTQGAAGAKNTATAAAGTRTTKRPMARTKLSGEEVEGLMK